jgi:nitroreductase
MSERQVDHPILDLFHRRWSPRAMTGETIAHQDLLALFEAARWAPSAFNNQPWRFLYAHRDSVHWPAFFGLLGESNQTWCAHAGALVLMAAKTTFDHNGAAARLYAFDAGAAWENFALEATHRGLVAHPMQGFDHIAAKSVMNLPDDLEPMIMIAVGHRGPAESLPDALKAREKPSPRKPLAELTHAGPYPPS